jgi:hypothetical protein
MQDGESIEPMWMNAGWSRLVLIAACLWPLRLPAADVTFFSYSDIHYGADAGGKKPPIVRSDTLPVINALPGTAYPDAIGGVVDVPRAILMPGDLINDGAVREKYPTQWANYVADFGVNGEGRCRFPVFEGVGNHDLNDDMFVFNQVKARNVIRKGLGFIDHVSLNGYHYSWDWDGVHFVNVNLFPGNVWEGEADTYGRGHHPNHARDFLVEDLRKNVGDSGRPVFVMQHFRPVDENWWTYSAADKFHQVLQDYNVVAILVGHQGGLVNNTWRGYNWISSNGELIVCRLKDDTFSAVHRTATGWGRAMQKRVFHSYADSGLPAVVNNGRWATNPTATSATLSGKIVYQAVAPTELTLYWGSEDGGDKAEAWQNSRKLGVQQAGVAASAEITGLAPWTTCYYRAAASNSRGVAWAAESIAFQTGGVLAAEWRSAFIGHAQRPGSGANFRDGAFTVRGSGRDIAERGETIDNFQFVYQDLAGDGEIAARVAGSEVESREPKVGVMFRESGTDGARNVALLLPPRSGLLLSARAEEGGGSRRTQVRAPATEPPCWLKLVRCGDTFTGHVSQDGEAWEPVGSPITVAMKPDVLVGLAVTAGCRDESKVHSTTFDHVSVSGRAPGP